MSGLEREGKLGEVDSSEIIECLEGLRDEEQDSMDWKMFNEVFPYYMKELLKSLGEREDINKKRFALVEWGFMQMYSYDEEPITLTQETLNDPKIFC